MNKQKIILVPIFLGIIFIFYSWYLSYPISLKSPYHFEYDYISYFYWLGIPLMFASFYYAITKIKNKNYQLLISIITSLLIYSKTYFYYIGYGSDINQFIGLTEYFISTGDLDYTRGYHSYYQWPNFFILTKITTCIMGIDLRIFSFILYFIITIVLSYFLYKYALKNNVNGYLYVITFFIILYYFLNFQWAPYTLSLIILLVLFNIVDISDSREVMLTIFIIFISLTYMHILVPIFFIIYIFIMYVIKKRENDSLSNKYKIIFITTLIIYLIIQMYNLFPLYIKNLMELYYMEFQHKVEVTIAGSVSKQPFIDVVAQFFSRMIVVATALITGFGFLTLFFGRKLKNMNYALLITGIIFIPTLIVSSKYYSNMFFRALPLICMPLCLGGSHLYDSKLKKYIKPIYLIILILFTFVLVHNSFYDRQIFTMSMNEYHNANFILDNINYNNSNRVLSHIRFMQYLVRPRLVRNVIFDNDFSTNISDIYKYNYVVYTIGLGKSYLRNNYSINDSFMEFQKYNFNLIYNAGYYSYVFHKGSNNLI